MTVSPKNGHIRVLLAVLLWSCMFFEYGNGWGLIEKREEGLKKQMEIASSQIPGRWKKFENYIISLTNSPALWDSLW